MSFRARLTLAAAAAVAVAVVARLGGRRTSLVRGELRGEVDDDAAGARRERAAASSACDPGGEQFLGHPAREPFGGVAVFTQLVRRRTASAITPPQTTVELPVTAATLAGARRARRRPFSRTRRSRGTHVRVLTLPLEHGGYALQVARSLEEVDRMLGAISALT